MRMHMMKATMEPMHQEHCIAVCEGLPVRAGTLLRQPFPPSLWAGQRQHEQLLSNGVILWGCLSPWQEGRKAPAQQPQPPSSARACPRSPPVHPSTRAGGRQPVKQCCWRRQALLALPQFPGVLLLLPRFPPPAAPCWLLEHSPTPQHTHDSILEQPSFYAADRSTVRI